MEKLPKINYLYEDNHLLVVEKPVNIPVCEDSSNDLDLLTLLKMELKKKYNKPGNVYLGLVHRLDRPVGGVMVFAKTSKCASRLSKQISDHTFEKVYYAVTTGNLEDSGVFTDYLIKNSKTNTVSVTNDKIKGKLSILSYEVIKRINHYNLVRVYLKTGRSHQIRVQFSSRGSALVGDHKYGKCDDNNVSVALFSKMIKFKHPVTGEVMKFELELPKRYPFNLF